MGHGLVNPELVSRGDLVRKGGRPALIHQSDDGVAIYGQRDRLPELVAAKPFLFAPDLRKLLRAQIVEIKKEEIVLEAGAKIIKPVASRTLVGGERRIVLRADFLEQIHVPGLETNH